MNMRKTTMVLAGLVFFLAGGQNANGQTGMLHLPGIRYCDPSTLAPHKGQYPVWDQAGVAPVIPEILREIRKGGMARLIVAEALRGPALTDSEERAAELKRAKIRIEQFNRISLFTAPGTDIRDLPPLPPDFSEAFDAATAVENLEEGFLPCGSVIHHVTSAAPDLNGVPQIEVLGAHVLGWCDTMLEGKCGAWVVQTKAALPVSSGPNAGNYYRFQMILNCGNPNAQFEAPKEEVQVTAPAEPEKAAPAAPTEPAQPRPAEPAAPAKPAGVPKPRGEPRFDFSAGTKLFRGWVNTTYDCVTEPSKCDAEQLHVTQGLMLTGRLVHRRTGWFGEGSVAVTGQNLNYAFMDPIPRPHEREMGQDQFWTVLAGKQWRVGKNAAVYVAGKVDGWCDCENYIQRYINLVETRNERKFVNYGAGVGISGDLKRTTIRVNGTLEPFGSRDRWGVQTGYPEGKDARQRAMHYGVDGEIGFSLWRLELFAGGGWSLRPSKRPGPASNPAYREWTQIRHLSGGVRLQVGRFLR